MFNIATQE